MEVESVEKSKIYGSPSPQLLEKFLEENKVNIHTIENLKFRNKTAFGLESGYKRISFDAQQDLYTFAFLTSLDYTENCYSCRYATLDRVSDITLGDSWGSELSREEQKKGISLILCQTEKGIELVKSAGFELEEVQLGKKTASERLCGFAGVNWTHLSRTRKPGSCQSGVS